MSGDSAVYSFTSLRTESKGKRQKLEEFDVEKADNHCCGHTNLWSEQSDNLIYQEK
jgi:hypothetical protein